MQVHGLSFSDLIGKSIEDDLLAPDLLPTFREQVVQALGSQQPQSLQHADAAPDGLRQHTAITFLPVTKDSGETDWVVVVFRDVTVERNQTEHIEALNFELNQQSGKLEEQNRALAAALRELKKTQAHIIQSEKLASIGQLAAGVAHEINNPTGFVSSNLETLEQYQTAIAQMIDAYRSLIDFVRDADMPAPLRTEITQHIQGIDELEQRLDLAYIQEDLVDLLGECREGMERIKKTVLDLKDFAHPGQEQRTATDINACIESTLNIVNNELKYKANIHKTYADLPEIICYPRQLNQVFMNILVNAGQAIDKDGEIRIQTDCCNGEVLITFADNGCGIAPEHLGKIFDPFYTTKAVGQGTGLGMHLAYNIIKKHAGTIEVDSRPGKGTIFTIHLPLVTEDQTDA